MNTNFTRAIHNEMAAMRAVETDYNRPGDYFVTESQYLFGGSRASGYVQSLIAKKYPTPTFNPAKVKKPSRWIQARTPPSRIRAPAVKEPETPKAKAKAPTPKAKAKAPTPKAKVMTTEEAFGDLLDLMEEPLRMAETGLRDIGFD